MKIALILFGAGATLFGVGFACYQKGRTDQWGYDRELINRTDETMRKAAAIVDEGMDLIADAAGLPRRNFVTTQASN